MMNDELGCTHTFPQCIAGRAELARYMLTRALITGGNATLTPGCNPIAFSGLFHANARGRIFRRGLAFQLKRAV